MDNGCSPNASASQTVTAKSTDIPSVFLNQNCNGDTLILMANPLNGSAYQRIAWQQWVNNYWQPIYSNNYYGEFILKLIKPKLGSIIKCILYSNDPCRTKDTANAIITLSCPQQTNSLVDTIIVSPNPNDGLFFLNLKLESRKNVTYAIFNQMGQQIMKSDLGSVIGNITKQIQLPFMAGSNYYLLELMIKRK